MKIDEILKKSNEINYLIKQSLINIQTGKTVKDLIVASYLSLTIEHHSSIIILIENNLISSAASLARPLLESLYRGTWIQYVSNESVCNEICNHDFNWKKTWELAKEIDEVLNETAFHNIYKNNVKSLNGYTHGGLEQLSRQINSEKRVLESSFSNEEIIELLNSSNCNLAMMLLTFSSNIGNNDLSRVAQNIILQK